MIEVKNLTKIYGKHKAVDDLSFTVKDGQIYGFLGPNGAGKSTTLNIITGCLSATDGSILVEGHDIFEDPYEAKKCIGFLPELPPLYLDMTAYEYLSFVAEAKGIKRNEITDEVIRVINETNIDEIKDRQMKYLSKGYKQRVGIAMALLGNPKVVILDEPTVGLDPKQIIEIRTLIKRLGKRHTVILSSHILTEVNTVCDHILIINKGKLVASDTPDNLAKLMNEDLKLLVTVRGDESATRIALNKLAPHVNFLHSDENHAITAELDVKDKKPHSDGTDLRDEVFRAVVASKGTILDMHYNYLSLEDIYLQLTSDSVEDKIETNNHPKKDEDQDRSSDNSEKEEDQADSKDQEVKS